MAASNINRVVLTGNLTFDPELRSLPSGMSICPYLTVQFFSHDIMADGDGPTKDKSNVECLAAFGCAALEERSRLRDMANQRRRSQQLPPQSSPWVEDEDAWLKETKKKDMMHFLILVSSRQHSIWVINDEENDTANPVGSAVAAHQYIVRNLVAVGDNTDTALMAAFAGWVNEIHGWGLGIFAPAVEADLDIVRQKYLGGA